METRRPRAKKSLGQNFLAAPRVAERIAGFLDPVPGDRVFEIGPGRGALTAPLALSGAALAAFEIDRALAAGLRAAYEGRPNVEIVEADIRGIDLDAEAARRGASGFKLAGNIPYNLTSTILIDLARWRRLGVAVLMVQREVGDRVLSPPGSRGCGILSIFLRSYFIMERMLTVRPGSFTPPPKVMSVVVRFTPDNASAGPADRTAYFAFLKACFSQRRKKLRSAVQALDVPGGAAALSARAGVDLDRRPEELSLGEWFALYDAWRALKGGTAC